MIYIFRERDRWSGLATTIHPSSSLTRLWMNAKGVTLRLSLAVGPADFLDSVPRSPRRLEASLLGHPGSGVHHAR